MTDKELLELAAKAAGLQVVWHELDDDSEPWCFIPDCHPPHNRRQRDKESGVIWNPLTDDGDALRLAVKLQIDICPSMCGSSKFRYAVYDGNTYGEVDSDPYAATRRAIVRAAAEIGRTK